jgi:hypothetical protein
LSNGNEADISDEDDDENGENNTNPTPVRQPLAQQVYNTRASSSQVATASSQKSQINNLPIELLKRVANATSALALTSQPDIILLNKQV